LGEGKKAVKKKAARKDFIGVERGMSEFGN
jgi:hypothetical protein